MKRRIKVAICLLVAAVGCDAPNNVAKVAPKGTIEIFSIAPTFASNTMQALDPTSGAQIWLVHPPVITTSDVNTVAAIRSNKRDQNGNPITGDPALQIDLTASGASKMKTFTTNRIGTQLAFAVNGTVMSTPVVNAPIDASLVITYNGIDKTVTTLTGFSTPK